MQRYSAVVLAGGRATRLGGANKALLEVGGRFLIDRVLDALAPVADQMVLVGHLADGVRRTGIDIIDDRLAGGSTMVAVYSGLLAARHDTSLVVACDLPFLSTELMRRIGSLSEGYDLAVPRVGSHLEALHAAYHRRCIPILEEAIALHQLKIINFYPRANTRIVEESEMRDLDPYLHSFLNVNTPEDLEKARSLVHGA